MADTTPNGAADPVRLLAQRLLDMNYDDIPDRERRVIERVAKRVVISRHPDAEHAAGLSLGEKVADKMAAFGGSWSFLFFFMAVLAAWVVLNSVLLATGFDPYPYILLNLFLSMLASIQAPVIMMSQNRHAARDRIRATHDYEVNLKAEIEIMALHEKLDEMRNNEIALLLKHIATKKL